jgi:hypothetical protein
MFFSKSIVIHFDSMVAENTKAVGNWFMKEDGAFIPSAQHTLDCYRRIHKTQRIVTMKRHKNTKEDYCHYSKETIYVLFCLS